eukprot:TRINITY_DN51993_c0_g1_i1.p1 TRINITY_DN51993_c0_g1~~TRINITY_DN51993_c0_g1_i1.p1  ORF type:complete len:461 (+),score=72.35 TRINITY_DN51993_c0_g1_i1:79-1461(+)
MAFPAMAGPADDAAAVLGGLHADTAEWLLQALTGAAGPGAAQQHAALTSGSGCSGPPAAGIAAPLDDLGLPMAQPLQVEALPAVEPPLGPGTALSTVSLLRDSLGLQQQQREPPPLPDFITLFGARVAEILATPPTAVPHQSSGRPPTAVHRDPRRADPRLMDPPAGRPDSAVQPPLPVSATGGGGWPEPGTRRVGAQARISRRVVAATGASVAVNADGTPQIPGTVGTSFPDDQQLSSGGPSEQEQVTNARTQTAAPRKRERRPPPRGRTTLAGAGPPTEADEVWQVQNRIRFGVPDKPRGQAAAVLVRTATDSLEYASPFCCQEGEHVIVDADRGYDIGVVEKCTPRPAATQWRDVVKGTQVRMPRMVLARATDEHIALWDAQVPHAERVMRYAQHLADELHLNLKFLTASFQLDYKKICLAFQASHVVDFRELQRRLFRHVTEQTGIHPRIWFEEIR